MTGTGRRSTDVNVTKLTVPLILVASIVATAVGFAWWFSGHLSRVEQGFVTINLTFEGKIEGVKNEISQLRTDLKYLTDGHVEEDKLKVWIEKLRATANHEIPEW